MRPIDQRFRPSVAGIDLVQALNYLDLDDAGETFLYDHYTNANLPYVPGSRPALEGIVDRLQLDDASPIEKVGAIATFVAEQVPWAGFYQRDLGKRLPTARALDEEGVIASGYGWCNEQARVFCALTQVAGIPSRLVFAANLKEHYGHVICEALLPDGWLAVDESFAFLFLRDGKPVRAADIYRDAACREYFTPRYRAICQELIETLGADILDPSFRMCLAENPLDGFQDIGYCNHFVV